MLRIELSRKEYLIKVEKIAHKIAIKHSVDWNVSDDKLQEFIKLETENTVYSATPKRGAWSIIDLDGTAYETKKAYIPYAPMQ